MVRLDVDTREGGLRVSASLSVEGEMRYGERRKGLVERALIPLVMDRLTRTELRGSPQGC